MAEFEKVTRLIRPKELTGNRKLVWTSGIGTDLWDMFCACITGDLSTVKRLLDKHPSLARAYYEYRTPIAFAVRDNQMEVAAYLLDHGADPFGTSGDLIGIARERGYAEMAQLLETKYASLHKASPKGDAIAEAIRSRDLPKVRRMLDENPELVNAGDSASNRPIHWAVMTRQIDIIDELLVRGADINAQRGDGARPIQLTNGDYSYRGWVHARDVPITPRQVLDHLRARGDKPMIELLASRGATWEIHMHPGDGLTYADIVATGLPRSMPILANYGDIDTASTMLADNPALADDEEALKMAASRGREDFVRLLLRYQPELASRVTVSRPREMAKLLFEHGMNPNLPNWLRITPLHGFAETGDVESAALFIDHGADLDARDEEWCATPLGWAAKFGHIRLVEYLLRRGARTRLADDPTWATPLALAAQHGHTQIVKLLTEYERSGTLPRYDMAYYEGLVRDILEASESGEEGAMRRLAAVFQIARGSFNWAQRTPAERMAKLRRFVVEQLSRYSGPESEHDVPWPADARLLVARAHGFETWTRLVEETARTS